MTERKVGRAGRLGRADALLKIAEEALHGAAAALRECEDVGTMLGWARVSQLTLEVAAVHTEVQKTVKAEGLA